ncbi:hypothetical protein [Cellulosimicrobium arenosum]|uniref:Primosomal protein N' (Replication factor Y)-superfamily II helicase n=1 Tax=Cellulosimicrobium arenosum TaxID=2708133 RepID=A0A927IZE4_9MICO|nr:hypothetical protein [Cellulosimicrobium arenosum]MBD8078187.1 hypothetical protein [Cellulosimicrobium arenosum]
MSELLSTRCDACGSQMTYAPGTGALECVACRSRIEIAHAPHERVDEHSYDTWLATGATAPVASVPLHELTCDGCGATTASSYLSDHCQFCGGHLVAAAVATGVLPPEAVLPFAVPGPAARDEFRRWVRSRWFAPNALKHVGDTEALRGTYVPHWTFDAQTTSEYSGQRGDAYYVTVGSGDNERRERRVRWRPAWGTVARSFDDVLVPAFTQLPEKFEKVGPWDLGAAVPYRPEYLAGYSTARYDVDPPVGLDRAKGTMESVIRSDVTSDIGGDEQRIHRIDTAYMAVMFKLVLLPLWLATYVYAGRQWQVMVNANTGEVVGNRPYSPWKITGAVLAGLVIVAAVIVLYQLLA